MGFYGRIQIPVFARSDLDSGFSRADTDSGFLKIESVSRFIKVGSGSRFFQGRIRIPFLKVGYGSWVFQGRIRIPFFFNTWSVSRFFLNTWFGSLWTPCIMFNPWKTTYGIQILLASSADRLFNDRFSRIIKE